MTYFSQATGHASVETEIDNKIFFTYKNGHNKVRTDIDNIISVPQTTSLINGGGKDDVQYCLWVLSCIIPINKGHGQNLSIKKI